MASGLYHYQGMALHFLSPSHSYAVYYNSKGKVNEQWIAYRIKYDCGSWKHSLVGKRGTLVEAIGEAQNDWKYQLNVNHNMIAW